MSTKIATGSRASFTLRWASLCSIALMLYILRDHVLPPQHHSEDAGLIVPLTPAQPGWSAIPLTQRPDEPISAATLADASSPHSSPDHGSVIGPTHGENQAAISLSTSDPCKGIPDTQNVMLLLKTGSTELYRKLPIHLLTTLRCLDSRNFIIFSDLAQTFAGQSIVDALAHVSPDYRDEHPEFDLYRTLQQYRRDGRDPGSLRSHVGWDLDKWKFLPIFHAAFGAAHAEIEWFVMIEADTSLSWNNLVLWLKTIDSNLPLYMGSQNFIGSTAFAHGGSGIVVSRRALELLEESRQNEGPAEYDRRWEDDTAQNCCGDEILARAFLVVNVPLTSAWPLLQGETPSSLDWTDRHWCTSPITWHHVGTAEIDALHHFEQAWRGGHDANTSYQFRDVFDHFVDQYIQTNRTGWSNLSSDHSYVNSSLSSSENEWDHLQDFERKAMDSMEGCAAACMHPSLPSCVQWMYQPGRCYLGDTLRLGQAVEESWISGWVEERVAKLKKRYEGCDVIWSVDANGED